MELLGIVLLSVLTSLAAAEIYDRGPFIARWLIKFAARRMPRASQQWYEEEWLAHAAECPGKIGQIVHAVGCVIASSRRRVRLSRDQSIKLVKAFSLAYIWSVRRAFPDGYRVLDRYTSTLVVRRRPRNGETPESRGARIARLSFMLNLRLDRWALINRLFRAAAASNRRRESK
jgi:hypothetical protein